MQAGPSLVTAGREDPAGRAPDLTTLLPALWSQDVARASCELPAKSGHFSGVCVNADEVPAVRARLGFCQDSVRYRACVPADQPLPNWASWNASAKDLQLGRLFKDTVEQRLAKEMNVTPDVYVPVHYLSNPACFVALKNLLCWYNFPKCDDNNVSLPLCTTSCNAYYRSCWYDGVRPDGSHPLCDANAVQSGGLFASGSAGPDQRLAEDNKICESAAELAENMPEVAASTSGGIFSPLGIALLALGGAVVIALMSYLLIPYGFRSYAAWFAWQFVARPLSLWRRMPTFRGRTVMLAFCLTFAALLGFGLYRRLDPTAGLSRFTPATDVSAASREIRPKPTADEVPTKKDLTPRQLKQLSVSCSCTGLARPGACPEPWAVASVMATLLWAALQPKA